MEKHEATSNILPPELYPEHTEPSTGYGLFDGLLYRGGCSLDTFVGKEAGLPAADTRKTPQLDLPGIQDPKLLSNPPASSAYSPPIAWGKVYRADRQTYTCQLIPPAVCTDRDGTDNLNSIAAAQDRNLIGAYYPPPPPPPAVGTPAGAPSLLLPGQQAAGCAYGPIAPPPPPRQKGPASVPVPARPLPAAAAAAVCGSLAATSLGDADEVAITPYRQRVFEVRWQLLSDREAKLQKDRADHKVFQTWLQAQHQEQQAEAARLQDLQADLAGMEQVLQASAATQKDMQAKLASTCEQLSAAMDRLDADKAKLRDAEAALQQGREALLQKIQALRLAKAVQHLLNSPGARAAATAAEAGCQTCLQNLLEKQVRVDASDESDAGSPRDTCRKREADNGPHTGTMADNRPHTGTMADVVKAAMVTSRNSTPDQRQLASPMFKSPAAAALPKPSLLRKQAKAAKGTPKGTPKKQGTPKVAMVGCCKAAATLIGSNCSTPKQDKTGTPKGTPKATPKGKIKILFRA